MNKPLPKRPFLLRALHQWITECGHTPHVIVDAGREGTEVPRAYVKDGKIVLNLSDGATQRLRLGTEAVEFDARFAGVVHHVHFPVSAVLGVYARETGEGMVFSEQDLGPEPPTHPPQSEEGGGGPRRPQLKVVK
jgi:stringent starvation protein B